MTPTEYFLLRFFNLSASDGRLVNGFGRFFGYSARIPEDSGLVSALSFLTTVGGRHSK